MKIWSEWHNADMSNCLVADLPRGDDDDDACF